MSVTTEVDRILIDSNVLGYTVDPASHEKQRVAVEVVDRLIRDERAVLSVQCLNEFVQIVTRTLRPRLAIDAAIDEMNAIADSCQVFDLTLDLVRAAGQAAIRHQMSMWDALLWATAATHRIPVILTEDLQSAPVIEGVRYINPFAPGFDIGAL